MNNTFDNRFSFSAQIDREDLVDICDSSLEVLKTLSDARIFLFGGTGFLGKWLTELFIFANRELCAGPEVTILTRRPADAITFFKVEERDRIRFIEADLSSGVPDIDSQFDYFIHAATASVPKTGSDDQSQVRRASLNATDAILNAAMKYANVPRVIHASSGAVLGLQQAGYSSLPEVESTADPTGLSPYAVTKILVEERLRAAQRDQIIRGFNPRLFAFFGPYMSLTDHFAIGNFLYDGLRGDKIRLNGNPRTTRSYLYPTDLIAWFLKLFVYDGVDSLNFGGSTAIAMEDLAHQISEMTSRRGVVLGSSDALASHYVPDTRLTREKLNVNQLVDLEVGLARWINWINRKN